MKRTAAVAAVIGLATGLGLGITGIAGAVDGKPSPRPHADRPHPGPGHPDRFPGPRGEKGRAGGIVTAVGADSITVARPRGSRTITLTDSTSYFDGKDPASKSVLRVGAVVRVRLVDPRAAKPVAKTVVVLPARLAGLVTKVDGSTLTIVDRDGFTRTIRSSQAGTVKVGQFVFAVGKVAADGTTLEARSLQVGRPKQHRHG
ncbi:MAG: DUF5666 domain-containing protein [Mycobacteriales bacterium]